ncbi:uncharacterized protein KY384_001343 [Bacidia gigantensis]|uniref:uncharacterized protein n=1 Tax=Bacidia gigantensis TaxID=2732470 RepID=UPI001D039468|nr:uncharacterized protein KY384_001343 [Bacidia gigantensis]KAG8533603.1 hypothetical protein KY384_001343 [Bacidia gigantensis]
MHLNLSLLSVSMVIVLAQATPIERHEENGLEKRETPCIASQNCGITQPKPQPSTGGDTGAGDTPITPVTPIGGNKPAPGSPEAILAIPTTPWPGGVSLKGFQRRCQRSDADIALITEELVVAIQIILKGTKIKGASPYYQSFFPPSLKNQPGFELLVQDKYSNAFAVYFDESEPLHISCSEDLPCGGDTVAYVYAGWNILNLCAPWWDNNIKQKSSVAGTECQPDHPNTDEWFNIGKFKETKCIADDYAYGYNRDNPNGPVGHCNPNLSFENADSLAFVIAGSAPDEPVEKEDQDLDIIVSTNPHGE